MKKPLTIKEFATLGGKARWKGKTKAERSAAMKRVRKGNVDEQAQVSPNTKSA